MATPIAPTPELKGKAARKFLEEMAKNKKASPEEIERIKSGAERIRKMLDFEF